MIERRISIQELAKLVGASNASVRTWVCSYRFNDFVFYDDIISKKPQLNILLCEEFCKKFIPYIASKDVKKKKKYVKNFNKNLEVLEEVCPSPL